MEASPLSHAHIQIMEHSDEAAVFCKIYHGAFKLQDKAEMEREEVTGEKAMLCRQQPNAWQHIVGGSSPRDLWLTWKQRLKALQVQS